MISSIKLNNYNILMPNIMSFNNSVTHQPKTILKKLIQQDIWRYFTIVRIDNNLKPFPNKLILEFLNKNKDKIDKIADTYLKELTQNKNKNNLLLFKDKHIKLLRESIYHANLYVDNLN